MWEKILLCFFIISQLILGGCSGSNEQEINTRESAEKTQITLKQNLQTNQGDTKKSLDSSPETVDMQKHISTLNKYLTDINNEKLSTDERINQLTKFTNGLRQLLLLEETVKLNDRDLEKALNHQIIAKSKSINLGGYNKTFRIVRFDGPQELSGTLERIWTYIQWEDSSKTNVQSLIEEGAEIANDFFVVNEKNKLFLVLTGYLTEYQPNPVFAASWRLNNARWEKTNLFSKKNASHDNWVYSTYDNELVIENTNKEPMLVETNQSNDGFAVSFSEGENKKIEFGFSGEQIVELK